MTEGTLLPAPGRRRARPALAGLLSLVLAAAACGGGADRPRRPAGSAVWVDPATAPLTAEGRRMLDRAGIEEVFLEAATLSWPGGRAELAQVPAAFDGAAPAGTPVTLVVRGEGPLASVDAGRAAAELHETLRALRFRAEEAGLLPTGVHFDFEPPGDLETSAEVLGTLRAGLGRDFLLSTTLPPALLGHDESRDLGAAVDYVVTSLYGQPPGVADDPSLWDPSSAARRAALLEAAQTDFVVGIHVLGRADHLGSGGDLRATTTRAALKPLAQNPALRLSIDDAFAGVGRLVHTFQAQGAARAVGWPLAPGDRIRVVCTAPALLREVVAGVEEAGLRHHTGFLFRRIAGPEEELSLAPAELAAALGSAPLRPDLHWQAVVQSRGADFVELRIELENRNRQRTDLAATDGNFLELRTQAAFFERVDPGGFSRYTLWRGDQEARPGTAWREPDRIRLYTPVVVGKERIEGAVIRLRVRVGPAVLFVSGRYFLPNGSELEIPGSGGAIEATMTGPEPAAGGQ